MFFAVIRLHVHGYIDLVANLCFDLILDVMCQTMSTPQGHEWIKFDVHIKEYMRLIATTADAVYIQYFGEAASNTLDFGMVQSGFIG